MKSKSSFFVGLLTLVALVGPWRGSASAQTLRDTWVTDGRVRTVATIGDIAYIGGDFTTIGPRTGGLVSFNAADGAVLGTQLPQVAGHVYAIVPDGSGGYFIGGNYLGVGGLPSDHMSHILATGTLDTNWNPDPNFTVHALALSGSDLYACGEFRSIGGQLRNGIAKLDPATGLAKPWNPDLGPIEGGTGCTSVAVVGSTVFAGGPIRNVGGASRNGFVALDANTGQVKFQSLTVDVNGFVRRMLLVGSNTLYLAGEFQTLGGSPRQGLAAINTDTGTVLPFNPNLPADPAGERDKILAMSLSEDGNTMYVGGLFNTNLSGQGTPTFGGQNRGNLAAVNMATGTVNPTWNPGADNVVRSVIAVGTTVYAAGAFRNFGGQPRNRLAAASMAGAGAVLSWNPNANDGGLTLLRNGVTLLVGGQFQSLGSRVQNNIAAVNLVTGVATDWAPALLCNSCTSQINEIIAAAGTLYVSGSFTNIGGQARNHVAALSPTTGLATTWAPALTGGGITGFNAVTDMDVSGSTIYIAGGFTTVTGTARNRLAAVDAGGVGALVGGFNPNPDSEVRKIAVGPGAGGATVLYAGGFFTNIGGEARNRVAALSLTTGAATAWNPGSTSTISNISALGVGTNAAGASTVYIGGNFSNIGGQARTNLAAIDVTSAAVTNFNPKPDFRVDQIVVFLNIVYIVGPFRAVGPYPRHQIAAIDASSGLVTAWNGEINPNHSVSNMGIAAVLPQGLLVVVGDFIVVLKRAQRGIAAMTLSGTAAGPRIMHPQFTDPLTAPIPLQRTPIATATAPIPFRVGDDDTGPANLTMTGASSIKSLVPDANVTFAVGATPENRTVTVRPVGTTGGVTTITLTVSDGTFTASTIFTVIVEGAAPPNTPPTITSPGNQTTTSGVASGPHTFTVGDNDPSTLTMSGTSSNTTLLPNANITFGGSGTSRNVTVAPAAGQSGTTTVTLIVTDAGGLTAQTTFTLTVTGGGGGNTPPTISAVGNQTTGVGVPSGPHAFTVGDAQTAAASLLLTSGSSNATLVPPGGISFGGSGANRTVTIAPAAGQSGSAIITVTVTDGGGLTAQTTFTLTVAASGNAPTISDIPDQQTPVSAAKGPLAFTVADAQTPAANLTVSATSSNTSLLPVANIVFGGSGGSRTVTLTPVAGQSGNTTVTITVSDGTLTASDTFVLLVKTISLTGPFYMSEGFTGPFFDLLISLANPNNVDAPVRLTFLRESGAPVSIEGTIPAMSRRSQLVDVVPGVENTAVSTVVESLSTPPLPVVVERTMFWNENLYGGHGEKAGSGGDRNWLFAEGSQGFFDTYLLLANPNPTDTVATIRFLTEGAGVVTDTVTVAANSRRTLYTNNYPALRNTSFGITVTFSQPAVAERAMYFGAARFWDGGHSSAGVNAPATRWFHAEGATGGFFDTYMLVANPNAVVANVVFTYFLPSGQIITKNKQIAANSRLTVLVDSEDAALADTAVSTQVTSDMPVVSERSMYWAGPFTNWFEAHNSFGATILTNKWGLAEGIVGFAERFETYILITNPNPAAMNVTVTFLRQTGAPIVKTYPVGATSRFNVHVNTAVPELANEFFGAIIEAPQNLAVERAMYWNAFGVLWAGGTNATAIPLRSPP